MRGIVNGLPLAAALWVLIGGIGSLFGVSWLAWTGGILAALCIALLLVGLLVHVGAE